MLADPQVAARQMVVETPHSTLGSVRTLGVPVKFSQTPAAVRHGAPVFGEHTRAVLREHGFSDDEIRRMIADGAAYAASEEVLR